LAGIVQATGLQTYIWNNNLRSALLLAGFPVLLVGMIWGLDFAFAMLGGSIETMDKALDTATRDLVLSAPLALVVAGVWFVIAYFFNGLIVDLATGSRQVTREEEPQLYNLLENLCISRGIPMPQLKIMEREELNAFASGLHQGRFSISVTRGLIQTLTPQELEAVLAHELTHILNRDVRTMVVASVFAGIITLIAQIIFRVFLRMGVGFRGRGRGGGMGALVFVAVAAAIGAVGYLLAIVIRMAISQTREYVADAGSVDLTKNPDAMITALQKVSGHAHVDAPQSVRAMFLQNDDRGVFGLFATHPPVEKRIEALVRYAAGRTDLISAPAEPAQPSQGEPSSEVGMERPAGPWGAPPSDA
jgi:heat shock protein HtpX